MADAIGSAYNELFTTYLDAQKRDKKTIQNFFASKWVVSATVASLMEQTFKQLCSLANFQAAQVEKPVTKDTTTITEEPIRVAAGEAHYRQHQYSATTACNRRCDDIR